MSSLPPPFKFASDAAGCTLHAWESLLNIAFLSSYTMYTFHVTGFHACSNNNTKIELNHPLFPFTSVVDKLVIDIVYKSNFCGKSKDNGRTLNQPPISGRIKHSTYFFHRKGVAVLQGLITGKLFTCWTISLSSFIHFIHSSRAISIDMSVILNTCF